MTRESRRLAGIPLIVPPMGSPGTSAPISLIALAYVCRARHRRVTLGVGRLRLDSR
jgi:hypothetical protein